MYNVLRHYNDNASITLCPSIIHILYIIYIYILRFKRVGLVHRMTRQDVLY